MESIKEFFRKLLGAILRSLIVSLIFVLIIFSVMTGKFPPDIAEIRKTIEQYRNFTKTSVAQIQRMQEMMGKVSQDQVQTGEANATALMEYNNQRAQMGEQLNQLVGRNETLRNAEKILKENMQNVQVAQLIEMDGKAFEKQQQQQQMQQQALQKNVESLVREVRSLRAQMNQLDHKLENLNRRIK